MTEGLTKEHATAIAESSLGPYFLLGFRKNPTLKEVVIREPTVIVDRYEPFPPYYTVISPTQYVDASVLFFELEKKDEPLPWKFSPRFVFQSGKLHEWEPDSLAVRDDFQTPLAVKILAKDEGLYTIRINIKAAGDFGEVREMAVVQKPETLGFSGPGSKITPAANQVRSVLLPGGMVKKP